MAGRTVVILLAAGAGSRFGGGKLLARLDGRPVLAHVLDALADAGLTEVTVVLGRDAVDVEAAIGWRSERRVVNPDPDRGLSSSLALGFEAIGPDVEQVLVALGDQPHISVRTIRALLAAPVDQGRPVVVPRYGNDRGRNPVLIRRPAFSLVAEATGDRGLGPVLETHADLVHEVAAEGSNPDIDTRGDLRRLAESAWSARVRANREQVDRIREVPDGHDFYAPVRSLFRADPSRSDDPVLGALLELVRPGETWLDVGAGAGRYALPLARALARSGGSVVALDPSASMLGALREIAEEHGIANVRTVEARWPTPDPRTLASDVVLIAHVGYDVEAIGPFVDGLEAAAGRLCVAVLMEQAPASAADPFWPRVHGEARVPLPALPSFVELLESAGRTPTVTRVASEVRRLESREALEGFARRQLWIDPSGPKESRFQAAIDELAVEEEGGWTIQGRAPMDIGVVTWEPPTVGRT